MVVAAFLLNIGLLSLFPLYFLTLNNGLRTTAFYTYIGILLFMGGFVGAIYSFPISETVHISGGNLAYGAFMMSVVMLIIIEHGVRTFRNIIRLVIMIDLFVFVGFNFLAWLLESEQLLNPFNIPFEIFHVSLSIILIGGILIVSEVLLLLFIFLQIRKKFSSLSLISFIYTLAFIVILCADGVLFPLLAFGLPANILSIITTNVLGKLLIAICYSVPMLGFYLLFRHHLTQFINTPLKMNELIHASREKLLETLSIYEVRDQQLQQDKQQLTKIAECDGLTELANRRKFEQVLVTEWSRCQREEQPLTLVIGDIDFFKLYNDTYGHQQGDTCLKEIAKLWGNIFNRPADLAARIGGEEFAIILPNTFVEESLDRLQYFLKSLQKRKIPHRASSIAPYVTMSIGVAEYFPHQGFSSKELFALTDQRLYTAKNSGRNKIVSD